MHFGIDVDLNGADAGGASRVTLLEARFSGDEFRAQIGVQQYISVNNGVTLSAFGTRAAPDHYFRARTI